MKDKEESELRENFHVTISKEELKSLPTQKFNGEIVVVSDSSQIDEVVDELERAQIIGFDTETKPAFQKGQINKIALLQLATESKSFLIRLCKIGLPERVKQLLENENILKVGLSIKDDFHSLSKISDISPKGFVDLQEFVKKYLIADCALTKIHAILFNKRISKGQQLSNWEAQTLNPKQQEYAALDALACVNIYKFLTSGDFKPELSPYYKALCQEGN